MRQLIALIWRGCCQGHWGVRREDLGDLEGEAREVSKTRGSLTSVVWAFICNAVNRATQSPSLHWMRLVLAVYQRHRGTATLPLSPSPLYCHIPPVSALRHCTAGQGRHSGAISNGPNLILSIAPGGTMERTRSPGCRAKPMHLVPDCLPPEYTERGSI